MPLIAGTERRLERLFGTPKYKDLGLLSSGKTSFRLETLLFSLLHDISGFIVLDLDVKCKVYENGRVAVDPETLRQLAQFSEREISKGTGLHRKPIRLLRHGGTVTRRTYQKIMNFLEEHVKPNTA